MNKKIPTPLESTKVEIWKDDIQRLRFGETIHLILTRYKLQSSCSVFGGQQSAQTRDAVLELFGSDRLEIGRPVRLGPADLRIVSDVVKLNGACNPDSLLRVAQVLALDGGHHFGVKVSPTR